MSLDWFYEIPWQLAALLIVCAWTVFAVGGMLVTRRAVARLWKDHESPPNDIVGFFFGTLGVFYGIALGLIAIASWENWSAIDGRVHEEAATVSALRNDTRAFPHPLNERLPGYLHDYLEFEGGTAWDAHVAGVKPPIDSAVRKFRDCLYNFAPRTMGESNLQAEAMRRWNDLLRMRRIRYSTADSHGMSVVVWWVVVLGGAVCIVVTWLFVISPRRAHAGLNALTSTMIGLLIFLLLAMDQPFRGDLAVERDPFRVSDQAVHSDSTQDHAADKPSEVCRVPVVRDIGAP